MSWAEIKKSVNSDLSTPLDKILKNTTYGLSAIKNAINAISTGGTVKIVKSVQRGARSGNGQVTISSVDVSKSIILLDGYPQVQASGTYASYFLPYVSAFISTAFSIANSGVTTNLSSSYTYISWQVIEFY